MPRKLWGEFTEGPITPTNDSNKFIPVGAKKAKLAEVQQEEPQGKDKNVTIKIKDPLVTQTIEVKKQTEFLQSLIDTYTNKLGSSNQLIPGQIIPEITFPPENVAEFKVNDSKYAKPFWFIPPGDSPFVRGVPQAYPQITPDICRASLRKAACGQLQVAGFTDTTESALVLFTDAIEEFTRSLMRNIQEVHSNDPIKETLPDLDVKTVEKAYFTMTNSSLTSLHNYFKHNIIARNRAEIAEYNGVLNEYEKLMKESQTTAKTEFQEGDFLNILDMGAPHTNEMIVGGTCIAPADHGGGSQLLTILAGQSHMSLQNSEVPAMRNVHYQATSETPPNAYITEISFPTQE